MNDNPEQYVSRLRRLLILIENTPGRMEWTPPDPEPVSLETYRQRKRMGAEIMAWMHERYDSDERRRKAHK